MRLRPRFISCGCNRVVHALDWGGGGGGGEVGGGLVAYGGASAVCIYDPEQDELLATLVGHTGRVNCVKWISSEACGDWHGCQLLASGAADGAVRVWAWRGERADPQWVCLHTLEGHGHPVTSLAVQPLDDEDGGGAGFLLASTSGGPDVVIWACRPAAPQPQPGSSEDGPAGGGAAPVDALCAAFGAASWREAQRIPVGAQTQLCAALAPLPGAPGWLLLASGGADNLVRLHVRPPGAGGQFKLQCKLAGHENWLISRYAPRPHVSAGGAPLWVSLEGLLVGHEDWVHTVCWRPQPPPPAAAGAGGQGRRRAASPPRRAALRLLSASQDRSMLLWRCDEGGGLWLSAASVGDAGATCLGYFGGVFSPDGSAVLAHGFTGALHLWRARGGGGGGAAGAAWLPRHAAGGHFGAAADVCWGADGRCVQSVSADQTARLFTDVAGKWCELARTQVHGHDFSCIAAIPAGGGGGGAAEGDGGSPEGGGGGCGGYMYVSGSEEKVLRVLEAPSAFLGTLDLARGRAPRGGGGPARRALGAAVGALALSNKAVFADAPPPDNGGGGGGELVGVADYPEGPDMLPRAAPAVTAGPPLEEHLSQNTLWPEARKLYGHGNDVFAAAASPCGRLVASACRAQGAAAAAVWVWEVGSWRAAAQLHAHALTATQLAFSPSGRLLLSGSRDRSFAVWRAGGGDGREEARFELLARVKAAHARIVWGVSWAHDESCFATCSRDHTVKLWAMDAAAGPSSAPLCALPPFPCPVTAVALAPAHACRAADGAEGAGAGPSAGAARHVAAVGLEDGGLQLWAVDVAAGGGGSGGGARLLWAARPGEGHAAAVRRAAWAPEAATAAGGGGGAALLVSCGDDHSVRVFEVEV
ncbi:MAG: WD40 repeat-like protein [Monoraphidium minutum]|nr:MAG: WD40 repeat-like protein [Monoraphidium minutum]